MKITIVISLLTVAISIVSIGQAYEAYKTMKRSQKTLCLLIIEHAGADHVEEDCVEYEQELMYENIK